MEEELKRSRVKGKLNEMWALLGAVGAFMERGRGDGQGGGQGEWAVVDDEGLAQIPQVRFFKKKMSDSTTYYLSCHFYKILAERQAGLQHLTKILQKDQKDLAIIMGSGTAGGDDGYLANEVENMWSSTNTSLRSSRLR
jgi:nuclear pore complex protein Nup54